MKLDVPELFFDFIGRIVPGCALILVATIVGIGPAKLMEYLKGLPAVSSTFLAICCILAGYLVSLAMNQLWESVRCLAPMRNTAPRLTLRQRLNPSLFYAKESLVHIPPRLWKDGNPIAIKLLKIEAENYLCTVLSSGFLVIVGYIAARAAWTQTIPTTPQLLQSAALVIAAGLFDRWRRTLQILFAGTLEQMETAPQVTAAATPAGKAA